MLIKNASVSQQDYDDAQSTYQQAKFNVDAAKATLETARINLERTKIKAPISGKIGISSVTPGSLITAEQSTPLAIIRSIDKVYVDFTQTSIDLLKLKKMLLSKNICVVRNSQPALTFSLRPLISSNLFLESGCTSG